MTLAACEKPPLTPFDHERASASLGRANLGACRGSGPPVSGHVTVVFAPTGRAQSAIVDGGPLVGTDAAKCVERILLELSVEPFSGPASRVAQQLRSDQ